MLHRVNKRRRIRFPPNAIAKLLLPVANGGREATFQSKIPIAGSLSVFITLTPNGLLSGILWSSALGSHPPSAAACVISNLGVVFRSDAIPAKGFPQPTEECLLLSGAASRERTLLRNLQRRPTSPASSMRHRRGSRPLPETSIARIGALPRN